MEWVVPVGQLEEGNLALAAFVQKFANSGVFLPTGLASQDLRLEFWTRSLSTCHAQFF